jgi:hypothetical protein
MYRILVLGLCLALLSVFSVQADEGDADAKMVSGMSIVGNDEAPKALYIVPWKSSEIGMETSLSMMLTESALPVDRDVFMRQLDYFAVSTADTGKGPAAMGLALY